MYSISRSTWSCLFPEISATCKLVMAETGKGRQKKAPCGWLDHTHRAEDETEERKLVISGLGAAKAACPGWAHRGRVSMIWTTLSIMSALRRSRPASGSNRIVILPSCGEGSRPWRAGSPGASLV